MVAGKVGNGWNDKAAHRAHRPPTTSIPHTCIQTTQLWKTLNDEVREFEVELQ